MFRPGRPVIRSGSTTTDWSEVTFSTSSRSDGRIQHLSVLCGTGATPLWVSFDFGRTHIELIPSTAYEDEIDAIRVHVRADGAQTYQMVGTLI